MGKLRHSELQQLFQEAELALGFEPRQSGSGCHTPNHHIVRQPKRGLHPLDAGKSWELLWGSGRGQADWYLFLSWHGVGNSASQDPTGVTMTEETDLTEASSAVFPGRTVRASWPPCISHVSILQCSLGENIVATYCQERRLAVITLERSPGGPRTQR